MFTYDNAIVTFREYRENRITVCKLTAHDSYAKGNRCNMIILGIARLKPGEERNQYEAQTVSLRQALKCAGFSHEYREIFFDAWDTDYKKRHKDVKPQKPPAKPTCDIPEGWYRLDDENEIVKSGDKVLWKIGPTDSTRGEILEHISSINNVSWWLNSITGVDKCVIRRVPPKPEPKPENYPIPAGYRKLGDKELMRAGDMYLAIDSRPQDFPDIWYGKPAELVAERITSHIVLRPIKTKMIHGKLMRKLEEDEYPQLGDWWGNDENDPIGCWVTSPDTTKRTTKEHDIHPVFWRPVDK